MSHTQTCRNCIVTGQMAIYDAAAMRVCRNQQRQHNKGKDACAARATMPLHFRQQQQCDAGNDASNTWARIPVQRQQRRQRGIGQRPSCRGQCQDNSKTTGNDKENGNNVTYANVS
jgi:hypothetical protein